MNMTLIDLITALKGAKLAAEVKNDLPLLILLDETITYLERQL